jgi:3D (Asp-Asp-Asp) domain-containing protein
LDYIGNRLGPVLSKLDWCKAALEGTVSVKDNDQVATYNFAVRATTLQVNCTHISNEEIRRKIGRNRFVLSKGKYGDGVQSMILVPYRTIAVDPRFIPYGSIVYIPEARGKEIILPSGRTVNHDGYFFAADTGSGIERNHIDVFCGLFDGNCFPNFIKSKETGTFRAFLISNNEIKNALRKEHTGT